VIGLINATIKGLKSLANSYSINVTLNKFARSYNQYNQYDSEEELSLKSVVIHNFERVMQIDKMFFKSRFRETEKIAQLVDKLTGFLNNSLNDGMSNLEESDC
jgi:hypothetical protein